jgi:hypothetical protein
MDTNLTFVDDDMEFLGRGGGVPQTVELREKSLLGWCCVADGDGAGEVPAMAVCYRR